MTVADAEQIDLPKLLLDSAQIDLDADKQVVAEQVADLVVRNRQLSEQLERAERVLDGLLSSLRK